MSLGGLLAIGDLQLPRREWVSPGTLWPMPAHANSVRRTSSTSAKRPKSTRETLADGDGAILIRRGRVIDPASGLDKILDVAVLNGKVVEIARRLSPGPARRVVDADGCIVTPGLVDPHVHLREPGHEHKETIQTGALAAARGGFTSICCMPNTNPALDSPELVRFVYDRADAALQAGGCRVFPVAAATKGRRGEEPTEIQLCSKAGAVAFSDDGDAVASAGVMSRVLTQVKGTGRVFMQHCQEPTLTRGAQMHAGSLSLKLGLGGWPRVAEEIIVERDIRLAKNSGCRYHVQHISSAGTCEILQRARKDDEGKRIVTGEASPHHLLLTADACDGYNTLAKVNPPLRERKDVDALREAVANGTVTVLATDHAPHTADEKALPFEEAPMGMVGIETALALYIEALVTSGAISWKRLIAMMTIEPARLCGLELCGLGTLKVGGPADITIIDPEITWTIRAAELTSMSKNTPFEGRRVMGRARATIVNGRVVFEAHSAPNSTI